MSLFTYWKTTFAHVSIEFLHIHKHSQPSVECACKTIYLLLEEYIFLIMSKRRYFSIHFFHSQCRFNQDIMWSPDFVLLKHPSVQTLFRVISGWCITRKTFFLMKCCYNMSSLSEITKTIMSNEVGIEANLNIALSKHTCIVSTVWLDPCDSADCRDSVSPYHSQPVWRDDLVSEHIFISFHSYISSKVWLLLSGVCVPQLKSNV